MPNGVQTNMGYDPDSRLITTTAIGPTGVVTPLNNSYSYAYNPDSWTTAITSMVGGITATNVITHDAMGRMVAGNASGRAQNWRYDGNGNLLSVTTPSNTTTYSYTAAITPNEVLTTTSTAGVTTTYSYDQNGDTTGISSTNGASTTLSYDSQARLDAVKLADGTLVVMTYNAQGQRVGYSVSKSGTTSESEQVTYRGDELAQAVISNTQRYTDTYLYDPSGAPLELIRQTKSGSSLSTARYWYVLNGHGDVVALTDVSGTVVDSYSYDLWGKLSSAVEAVPQRLRYAGYWYDQELGWYWVAVRSYNPTLMRWLQPDPSQQDGVRTYVYVGDDPVDRTDPTGLYTNLCNSFLGVLLPSCNKHENAVYLFLIGTDLHTLGSNAGFAAKALAIVDLASNVTLLMPVEGIADRAGIKVALTVSRDLVEHGTTDAVNVAYRLGRPVKAITRTLDHALNPEQYLYDVAKKYGINLRDVKIVFDPHLPPGVLGKTTEADGGSVIRIGPQALQSDAEAANTIAHELNHARDLLKNGKLLPADIGEPKARAAGEAVQAWIEGQR